MGTCCLLLVTILTVVPPSFKKPNLKSSQWSYRKKIYFISIWSRVARYFQNTFCCSCILQVFEKALWCGRLSLKCHFPTTGTTVTKRHYQKPILFDPKITTCACCLFCTVLSLLTCVSANRLGICQQTQIVSSQEIFNLSSMSCFLLQEA